MIQSRFLERGEFDSSIIGHRIIGINFETAHPSGFNLIIRVRIGEIENCNWFFYHERESLELVNPMNLLGKKITNVEYYTEGTEGSVKITVENGWSIWFKQFQA